MTSFETLIVCVYSVVWVCSFALLFRHDRFAMMSFILTVPGVLIAGFMDAFPESGRVANSRAFFFCNAGFLLMILWIEMQGHTATIEYAVDIPFGSFGKWKVSARSYALSSAFNLLIFGLKNFFCCMVSPKSLMVLHSSLKSQKIDPLLLEVLQNVHKIVLAATERTRPRKTKNETVDYLPQVGHNQVLPLQDLYSACPVST